MIHDPRTDHEKTPEGRIAAVAFDILDETVVNYAKTGSGPKLPDRADFRDGLKLYVEREILQAKLEVVKEHGTFPVARSLQKKLDAVNREISKKEKS